ncbi:S8 family serine peptidase [Crossiella cryophila]|uniref:Subtilisin family serine protease n=1 Tax=Crossiella cryophila TaxID=43355 RepID=A0A7W7CKE2_9PSEU|nr:S8 family serine peptidase [Crossiella cryophila]MBB4681421.1 subtilisin family serine protease [Crossiella cryophila]
MRRQLAVACATFVLAANGGVAAAQDTVLPQIPQVLRAGQPCTGSSGKKITETPWQLPYLGADRLWPLSTGAGVTVAVVDTGVDSTAVPVEALGDAGKDCVGHGTVVASLIGAPVREGFKFAGLAPGARVLAVRGTDKSGVPSAGGIAGAIDAAVAAGARVICVAVGVAEADPGLGKAIERALAAGALVVAAAGPDSLPNKKVEPGPYYPAGFPGVLAVSALGPDGKAEAGSPGVLAAPGNLVVGTGPGGGQVVGSGPAFAAAHVAAAAALIRAYRPEITGSELAKRLRDKAYRQPGLAMLDPLAALTANQAEAPVTARREPVALAAVPDTVGPQRSALIVAGIVALAGCLLGAVAVVVPLGRRRGWRGGGR